MSNNETVVFYNPPRTANGDRDWRAEVTAWVQERNKGHWASQIDQGTMVVIDNLLDALDAARKERDDARSPGAWRYLTNPNDRIQ